MAIKKQVPGKPGKAATKPAVKKVVKTAVAEPKKVAKPLTVKNAVIQKTAAKPASKKVIAPVAKPVKKVVKAAPAKPIAVKKVSKPVVVAVIPVTKKPLPVVKKAFPVKETIVPVKVNIKPAVKAPEKAVKPANQLMAKKEEVKKVEAKEISSKKPAAEVKAKDIKVPTPKPVAIPKISTKTVRKYQPDFTKSVLDKVVVETQGPTLRYSDAELVEFRELIQRKLEAAKKELSYLHGLITRKDEMGGDEGDNRYMTMEDGSLSMEREQLSQMASRQITFIDHLEKAVMRIENKTYGICRVTGKLIDKARLRAVPHATLSIEAKMISSK
jgi:RNA polymerase-binding transcription factor DksA